MITEEEKIEQQRMLLFQKYIRLFNHEIFYASIELETLDEIRELEKTVWPGERRLRLNGGSITYTTSVRIHRNATDAVAFAMLKECEAYQIKDFIVTIEPRSAAFLVNCGFYIQKLELRKNGFGERELSRTAVGKGCREFECQIVNE